VGATLTGTGTNREAVAAIYRRHSADVYGYIRSIVLDPHEAEDLMQQVFIKLMTAQPAVTGPDFAPWLLRVARNTAIDSMRRRRRTVLRDPHTWSEGGEAPDDEARRSLDGALRELSRCQRDALLLTDILGLTPDEAACRLGKSAGAVHMLNHRARRIVRDKLIGWGSAPCTQSARPKARSEPVRGAGERPGRPDRAEHASPQSLVGGEDESGRLAPAVHAQAAEGGR
jgi:RNA polymerase sigma-70 factor (ECF subfamily)